MGNFPSAAATIQPVDIPSPLDQYSRIMNMKNVMQRAKINDVQLQQERMNLQTAQQQQKELQPRRLVG
jgi:hypothetical protein